VGAGMLMILLGAVGLLLARRGSLATSPRFLRLAVWAVPLPFAANAMGWIFTEMGRQPWVVQGLLRTDDAVSPIVSAWTVGLSLAGFTLLYGVLAGVAGWLALREIRRPYPEGEPGGPAEPTEPSLAY
jgi:cytochrome d ubiquinol oxidase subunit I